MFQLLLFPFISAKYTGLFQKTIHINPISDLSTLKSLKIS